MAKFRIAVDTGGTFTDIFVFNEETGQVHIQKVPFNAGQSVQGH